MKHANIAGAMLGVFIFAGLAGCAEAPSDSDVKRVIGNLTGNCQYFTITHVLKLNWAVPGSKDYQVDLQYAIRVAPLPDAKTITAALNAPLAALNVEVAAATAESDKDFNINASYLDRIERSQKAGNETAALAYERQRSAFSAAELEPSLKRSRQLAEKKTNLIKRGIQPLRDEFFKACPNTPASLYDRLYDNQDLEQYVATRTVDLAASIRMTKQGDEWDVKR